MAVEQREVGAGLPGVVLSYGGSRVELALYGAHITSWTTPPSLPSPSTSPTTSPSLTPSPSGVQRLWLSSLSPLDGTAPIRGGIPIAWPQFASDGPLPLHGFARELVWSLVRSDTPQPEGSASVTLALSHSEHTINGTWREPAVAPFPWRFRLEYTVTLGPTHLQLRLQATNLGSLLGGEEKMAFTTCLHTYFRTCNSTQVQLRGALRGVPFVDKARPALLA